MYSLIWSGFSGEQCGPWASCCVFWRDLFLTLTVEVNWCIYWLCLFYREWKTMGCSGTETVCWCVCQEERIPYPCYTPLGSTSSILEPRYALWIIITVSHLTDNFTGKKCQMTYNAPIHHKTKWIQLYDRG